MVRSVRSGRRMALTFPLISGFGRVAFLKRCDVWVLSRWNGSGVRLTSSPSECGLDHVKFPTNL